jgi:hypothetical protein
MLSPIPEINNRLTALGFSNNRTGGHMARSMMLEEISTLCKNLPSDTLLETYKKAILDDNILGKPTFSSRQKSLRHLVQLYSLDTSCALFREYRRLAEVDGSSLPLLSAICTFCRDPQLRYSFNLIENLRAGEVLPREKMEACIEEGFPNRYSATMKQSLAKNVNATWTAAGHLSGKAIKKRTLPAPQFAASIYAMFVGYLTGLRAEMLVNSVFARLAGHQDIGILQSHLVSGAARGWLRYRNSGGVIEIDFTPLLTDKERKLLHGSD